MMATLPMSFGALTYRIGQAVKPLKQFRTAGPVFSTVVVGLPKENLRPVQ